MSLSEEAFVASVVQALNSAMVPCVLWGHCLLQAHGVPTIVASIDFVVPDHRLLVGSKILTQVEDLFPCTDSKCTKISPKRPTPPPAFHLHTKHPGFTVGLYVQSETLWFLPSLEVLLGLDGQLDLPRAFVLASDKTVLPPARLSRGSGAYESTDHRVIVPRSHILLEAFMRLYARDRGKYRGGFSMAMIAYMEEYVDDDGYLDVNLLPVFLQGLYAELREGKKPVFQWTLELQEALGEPPVDSYAKLMEG